jgi:hypothetical protein
MVICEHGSVRQMGRGRAFARFAGQATQVFQVSEIAVALMLFRNRSRIVVGSVGP